jgi:hypothetical protein
MIVPHAPQRFRHDFDVFLSHNSTDKVIVGELKAVLEKQGLSVWLDMEQLRPGLNWSLLLEQGLQSSGSVVVALGSAGMGPWQSEEVGVSLNHAVTLGRPVIPVFLPGCPKDQSVHGFLSSRGWVDFRDGFSDAQIESLVWGITGEKRCKTSHGFSTGNPESRKWILIAGSGGAIPRPKSFRPLCEVIGSQLAMSGFSLVTGGWEGVDDCVARSFAKRILKNGSALSGRLVQIMKEGSTPNFPAGRLICEPSEMAAWRSSIQRADGVVLVGGMGGTYQTGIWASESGKPVFPLADTQGRLGSHTDAYRFFHEMKQDWGSFPLSKLLSEADFECLGNPTPEVVSDLICLLNKTLLRA